MELNIEYVPITNIKPYEGNAKLHPDEQVNQIALSIQQMGFNDPIAIWKNGEIIEGHGRYLAAKKLGIDTVPIIRLDSLTDEQRRAYSLIHNKLTMNSGFDIQALDIEISGIEEFEMADFGFLIELDDDAPEAGLDSDEVQDEKTVVRLVFRTYKEYAMHEKQIKELAEAIGASVTVGK